MRPQFLAQTYAAPRRRRCDCCDRTVLVEGRVLLMLQPRVIGDFNLCPSCQEVFLAAAAGEEATALPKGGDNDGCYLGPSE